MPVAKNPFLLFDGHALVHRAYHALPNLTVARTGEPVGAVYGVATMLLKAMADFKPALIAFAFDLPVPTFRHLEYPEYKANRSPGPDDLRSQFPRVKELVAAFDIPIFELAGFEADDILGTLSKMAESKGIDCVIVTGDGDTYQLVDDHVMVMTTRKGISDTVLYDADAIRERYGLHPRQIPDLKALQGDSSDNIKGVPGIGEKTATKLLQQFGTLERLLDHADEVSPDRIKGALLANKAQALECKHLATIVRNVPISLDLEACRVRPFNRERIVELFRELDFRTLLARVPMGAAGDAKEEPRSQIQLTMFGPQSASSGSPSQEQSATGFGVPHTVVRTTAELDRLCELLAKAESISLDTETDDKDEMRARLVGIALMPLPGNEAFYVPVGHTKGHTMQIVAGKSPAAALIDVGPAANQLPLDLVLDRLRPTLGDPAKPKITHNGKYDLVVLAESGLDVNGLAFDTMVAAYLLNERAIGLKDLAFSRLGVEMTPISELIGKGLKQITVAEVGIDQAAAYASADVVATAKLRDVFEPELQQLDLASLFSQVEMPLIPVLVQMERYGVTLDRQMLGDLAREISQKMSENELAIYNSVGHRFNINSTQQLGGILFEELKLPSTRRTKTGYSTDAQVLDELRGQHEVVDLVLEYRQLTKLKSTYVDALPALINPKTGRVHTNFNQTVARTGRLSSSEPNLQNIPVRTPLGRRIRQAFIASKPGDVLLAADYSQIELRVLAHISRDPRLVEAFEADKDIHAATAAAIFNVEPDMVTADMRRVAKTTNFGVIYGISDFGLSERTDLSRREAGDFIRNYFETYPGIREYIERTKADARNGKVRTLFGRIQLFPEREILSTNAVVRGAIERTAVNMPIQGSAADIIKMAMIRLSYELKQTDIECNLILQVHDELVLEVEASRLQDLAKLVKDVMEHAVELSIPLKVDLKSGNNWNEMTSVHV